MDDYGRNTAEDGDAGSPETPEDVAVLYTWANVHGGKYRDFSASKREYRAQQRHRMVEAQRQAELEAARDKERIAAEELEEARRLEADTSDDTQARVDAEDVRRRAEERVQHERLAAQRHVETAEELKLALEQAQREMEVARRRAEEQAARYAEADARLRAQQQVDVVPGEMNDPYYYAGPLEPGAFAPGKGVRSSVPQRVSSERRIAESYYKARGESSGAVPARAEEDAFGLFSSGQRPRSSSSSRRIYEETPPAPVEVRIETPEDREERHRADEVERFADHRSGAQFDDNDDDGYYDGVTQVPQLRPADAASPRRRNSAPSDLHIPPRVQQTRTGDSVSRPAAVAVPMDDPSPGNTHMLDQSRSSRRREAVPAEATTRTERRPRPSDPDGHSAEANARPAGDAVRSAPRALDNSDAGRRTEREARPEWLVRSSKPSRLPESDLDRGAQTNAANAGKDAAPDAARESRSFGERSAARREERRSKLRSTFGGEEQRIPAADGGVNLRPMGERSEPPRMPEPATPPRGPADQQDAPQTAAALRAQERAEAEEALRAELSGRDWMRPEGPPGGVERRRYDRVTGARNASTVPDITREHRSVEAAGRQAHPAGEVGRETPARAMAPVEPKDARSNGRSAGPVPSDTLQQSRERVAARWFALKGLMGASGEGAVEAPQPPRAKDAAVPVLCVVSLSGGTGKTSLVATLGRALSSSGEKVLLADTTAHGILPYYFGARELRPDVVRTFSPPAGSADAPVYMVNYESERLLSDEAAQESLVEEIARHARGTQRVLLDLNGGSAWLARRLARGNSTILVPVAPDMNSVLGIQAVERFFAGTQDAEGRPVLPRYVLNQFDASLPLHLDVREVLRRQLGDRLLPVMVRRSPSVAEALAEGMTVIDYAPESPVTEDYTHLADWLRNLAAPATTGLRSIRWSER